MDSGLHAMRWRREQAIRVLIPTILEHLNRVTTEIERYCV